MRKKLKIIIIFFVSLGLFSCEKDIEIVLPEDEVKIVVEGSIEQGLPPMVMLTKSAGFFEPTDLASIKGLVINNAVVTVSDGDVSIELIEICANQLTEPILQAVSDLLGIPVSDLLASELCLYTTLDPSFVGEVGKTYQLTVQTEIGTITSSTRIPELVFMDRYWYKDQPGFDNYGYLWFYLSDPIEFGNSYRIYTQRKGKDDRYIPANGSVFDDSFFNGLSFEAFIFGGHELEGELFGSGYFEQGDTVFIKFCSIDQPHFQFWDSFEIAVFNNGNPFAAPATVRTNIQGGFGVWGGYGATYDTIVLVD